MPDLLLSVGEEMDRASLAWQRSTRAVIWFQNLCQAMMEACANYEAALDHFRNACRMMSKVDSGG